MKTLRSLLALVLFVPAFANAQVNWKFDNSHSNVMFTVSHLVISEVTGFFKEYDGTVTTAKNDDFTDAKITFTVKTKSINTDNEQRDNHLRADDFFNAEKFPEMKFVSKSMKKGKGKNFVLTGDLTIRDKTKQVKLDVTHLGIVKDPWGNTKSAFKLSGSINRFDYDLKWDKAIETGGLVVGKDVKINANIQLALQK